MKLYHLYIDNSLDVHGSFTEPPVKPTDPFLVEGEDFEYEYQFTNKLLPVYNQALDRWKAEAIRFEDQNKGKAVYRIAIFNGSEHKGMASWFHASFQEPTADTFLKVEGLEVEVVEQFLSANDNEWYEDGDPMQFGGVKEYRQVLRIKS